MPAPETGIPEGFELLERGGAYFRQLGPIYSRPDGGGCVIALRVAERHLNSQNITHGGMLLTLADSALGVNVALARGTRRAGQVTVSLSADFLAPARVGDWLEAHVTVTRIGSAMGYASCDLRAGTRHVLRSSGVFAFHDRPLPRAAGAAALGDDG
jgi:uncharacterized protein (TIGR00369 family)